MTEFVMQKDWASVLEEEFQKPYMKNLQAFLQKELEEQKVIYPPKDLIFNAFCKTALHQVKVVIVGQDPYHNPGQAEGLAFSVAKGVTPPPSLKNIYKELQSDLGITPPNHGSLVSWAKQGVLLINATLTVEAHNPKSHHGKGWEIFTDQVVNLLSQKKAPLVFILWGKSAQDKCTKVLTQPNPLHLVLTSAHPSPYSAMYGFFESKPFSKANAFLQMHGISPINWNLK